MDTKIFFSKQEQQNFDKIREISRKSKDFKEFQKNLKSRGFETKIKFNKKGKVKDVEFKKGEHKINSTKANERTFTDNIVKNIEKNREATKMLEKAQNKKPEYNRFDAIKQQREERTKLLGRDMYDTKGLSK